ncbi:DUF1615 family protein, partial [Duffyella gerundensis]
MNRSLQKLTVPLALLLASCSHHPSDNASAPRPAEVKAQIARLLPEGVSDRQGWAGDIYVAFNGQNLPPSVSNLCAVIAVTGQ